MSGPKARFTIVIGFLLIGWWSWDIASTYLFGERGLDFTLYSQGVSQMGLAALGGFGLVWMAVKLAQRAQQRKTGFEAEIRDEYGTTFKMGAGSNTKPFPMQLSKFLPDIIAAPNWPGLSPMEAELFGFLNGYRHWPADPDHGEENLPDRALARWTVMRDLPGAGPWHRVMALTADLGKIHAYREVRTQAPLRQFWKRDKVRFVRRSSSHGGLAAFILSTMPGWRALAAKKDPELKDQRRALLAALRYADDPRLLPQNAPPLARELLDYLQRAEANLLATIGPINPPTPSEEEDFKQHLKTYLPALMDDLVLSNTPNNEGIEGVILANARVLARPASLLAVLARNLPTHLRQRFSLWDGAGPQHPAWVLVASELQAMKVWVISQDDIVQPAFGWMWEMKPAEGGATIPFGPAILLDFSGMPLMQQKLINLPQWPGTAEPHMAPDDVKHMLVGQAAHLDALLQGPNSLFELPKM